MTHRPDRRVQILVVSLIFLREFFVAHLAVMLIESGAKNLPWRLQILSHSMRGVNPTNETRTKTNLSAACSFSSPLPSISESPRPWLRSEIRRIRP